MPRVKLDPCYWQYVARDELKKCRQADIADALGITQQAVSQRIPKLQFTLPELAVIVRSGALSADALVKVVKLIE